MPVTAATELQFLWRNRAIHSDFRSGVSLHSHTMYSQESLEIIPCWIATALSLRCVLGRPHAISDIRTGFWTPPLTPRQAHRLEEKQIQAQFQLPALVSLTDHDDTRAGTLLRVLDRFRHAPISTEWTVPFDRTFFHLGVHNLPPSDANAVAAQLASFTASPEYSKLSGILAMLSSYPDVLLVLNHPLWDESGIGKSNHNHALRSFLDRYGRYLHALEANGLRSWRENNMVLRLGRDANFPVVAGGDRHGLEPNAILNLSRSTTLVEFIHEIRRQRFSHVVLMPQYRLSGKLRIFHMVVDVLRDYPQNMEGRRTWGDRVFLRHPETGAPIPFANSLGDAGPKLIKHVLAAMRLVDRRPSPVILTNA